MAKLKRALARAQRRADGGGVDDPTAGMSPVDLMKLRAELPDRRTATERATARQGNRAELFDLVLGGRTAAEMGRDIAAAPTLPAAAAQTGIAGLEAGLGLLGMRGPGKGAGNRLNVFVGPESKTADRDALALAEQMREAGSPRGAIWSQTGWGWDEMGNPFYEIDDSLSKLRTRGAGEAAPKKFSEFYDHPELFAARPDIGEMKFARGDVPRGGGDFERPGYGFEGKIRVAKGTDQRGVALHEAQHAADQRRGSSWGASPYEPNRDDLRVASSKIFEHPELGPLVQNVEALKARAHEITDKFGADSPESFEAFNQMHAAELARNRAAYNLNMHVDPAMLAYQRNAGEVRARNTADERADMTALQRRQQNPWSTQDTPDQDQLFGQMQRRPQFAAGGRVARALRRAVVTVGAVRGATPGRADELEVDVPVGAYVIPADVVSALGEGNTEAGMVRLEKQMGKGVKPARANGGSVPILISDGEFVVSPEAVDAAGGNDALDKFVLAVRDAFTRHLQSIPGPNV